MKQDRNYLKTKFETGDTPTEQDFVDFFDTYASMEEALSSVKIKFFWGKTEGSDNDGTHPEDRYRYSNHIDGTVYELGVELLNWDVIKGMGENYTYKLLLDKYRGREFGRNGDNGRKAGYKHEVPNNNGSTLYDDRINEFEIKQSSFYLWDLYPEKYFKKSGTDGSKANFPAIRGYHSKL